MCICSLFCSFKKLCSPHPPATRTRFKAFVLFLVSSGTASYGRSSKSSPRQIACVRLFSPLFIDPHIKLVARMLLPCSPGVWTGTNTGRYQSDEQTPGRRFCHDWGWCIAAPCDTSKAHQYKAASFGMRFLKRGRGQKTIGQWRAVIIFGEFTG